MIRQSYCQKTNKHVWCKLQRDKTNLYRINNIEVISERLGSLKITNKASEEMNKQSDKEISEVPALMNENVQITISKSMVLDLE